MAKELLEILANSRITPSRSCRAKDGVLSFLKAIIIPIYDALKAVIISFQRKLFLYDIVCCTVSTYDKETALLKICLIKLNVYWNVSLFLFNLFLLIL